MQAPPLKVNHTTQDHSMETKQDRKTYPSSMISQPFINISQKKTKK